MSHSGANTNHRDPVGSPKVCIVGAGFSGLCAAIKLLKELNRNATIIFVDMNYTNFERRPDWRAQYASDKEIRGYLQDVAKKYNLYSKTRFETAVRKVEWSNHLRQWIVTIHDIRGENTFTKNYDIVLTATGSIRIPNIPEEFKGFNGPILHSAEWDDSIDLVNKRIAVIGTGASAIQVIPQVSKVASELFVFQRKPSWIFPKFDFEFGSIGGFLFKHIPFVLSIYAMLLFYMTELVYYGMIKKSFVARQCTSVCNYFRKWQLGDRDDLYDKLTPNYDFGCQRTAFASDYYPVFTKPTTTLVTERVASVTSNSLVTTEGRRFEIDILILATGFRITDYFSPMEIIDKDGEKVVKVWKKDAPSLFMGMAGHTMPNLFILYGPNTSTGHSSVVLTVELQMEWVVNCLREMMKRGADVVTVKPSVQADYMQDMQNRFRIMVWNASLCSPWYTDEKGRNVSIFPWNLSTYKRRVRAFDFAQQLDFLPSSSDL